MELWYDEIINYTNYASGEFSTDTGKSVCLSVRPSLPLCLSLCVCLSLFLSVSLCFSLSLSRAPPPPPSFSLAPVLCLFVCLPACLSLSLARSLPPPPPPPGLFSLTQVITVLSGHFMHALTVLTGSLHASGNGWDRFTSVHASGFCGRKLQACANCSDSSPHADT